jgi:hypothetical protein
MADTYAHSGRETVAVSLSSVPTETGRAALTVWTFEYLVRAPRPLQEMSDLELQLLGAEITIALQTICARRKAGNGLRQHDGPADSAD